MNRKHESTITGRPTEVITIMENTTLSKALITMDQILTKIITNRTTKILTNVNIIFIIMTLVVIVRKQLPLIVITETQPDKNHI